MAEGPQERHGGGSIAGVLIAVAIIAFYFFAMVSDVEMDQSEAAVMKVLVALAAGILSFFIPGALNIEGGAARKLSAAGGFGVFVLVLWVMFDLDPASASRPASDAGGPVVMGPDTLPPQTGPDTLPPQTHTFPPQTGPIAGSGFGNVTQAPAVYTFSTFCDECCPGGPFNCPYSGWGQAIDAGDAARIAVQMCVSAGGFPDRCEANVTPVRN
jgi:hypothetical protein